MRGAGEGIEANRTSPRLSIDAADPARDWDRRDAMEVSGSTYDIWRGKRMDALEEVCERVPPSSPCAHTSAQPPSHDSCMWKSTTRINAPWIHGITSIPLASQQEAVSSVPYEIIDKILATSSATFRPSRRAPSEMTRYFPHPRCSAHCVHHLRLRPLPAHRRSYLASQNTSTVSPTSSLRMGQL